MKITWHLAYSLRDDYTKNSHFTSSIQFSLKGLENQYVLSLGVKKVNLKSTAFSLC